VKINSSLLSIILKNPYNVIINETIELATTQKHVDSFLVVKRKA